MSKPEYAAWKCGMLNQIREEHPDWKEKTVKKYFRAVKKVLKNKEFFK